MFQGFSLPKEKKIEKKYSFTYKWPKQNTYLTKTKTLLKLEDNTNNEHQHIPQTITKYSQDLRGKHRNHRKARSYSVIHKCNQHAQFKQ